MGKATARWAWGLAAASLLSPLTAAHAANGVVGTGTPASCTTTSFDTVFASVQSTNGGTITFNCGSAPQAIILTTLKTVSTNTIMQGAGLITLSGGNSTSLFRVLATATLTLDDIALTRANGTYGAIENLGRLNVLGSRLNRNMATVSGGAILSHGILTLSNSIVSDNVATQFGGGVYVDLGSAAIDGSRFADNTLATTATNTLPAGGGAIALAAGTNSTIAGSEFSGNKTTGRVDNGGAISTAGILTLTDSTLRQNTATGPQLGGGIYISGGTTTLARTVIIGNMAGIGAGISQQGGALFVTDVALANNGVDSAGEPLAVFGGGFSAGEGTATLTNVTINGNGAVSGGGFGNDRATTTLTNTTIAGNRATNGGGIYQAGGRVTLVNATVIGNTAALNGDGIFTANASLTSLKNTALTNNGPNCNVPLASATFSMASDSTCGFGPGRDSQNLDFEFNVNNGGFTFTVMPAPGSRMIDNGTGAGCPSTDQRGVARPAGLACDIGAVEYVPGAAPIATAVEYFHAGFRHYFIANLPEEIFKLDAGGFEGWARTGQRFNVYSSPLRTLGPGAKASTAVRKAVCRFFTVAFPPTSSHFYAPEGLGCEGTQKNPDWQYEGNVFDSPLPDATGACAAGDIPVYRLYNNGQGGAPNHRFTVSQAIRQQMIAQGYIAEGAGIGVGMCSPQ